MYVSVLSSAYDVRADIIYYGINLFEKELSTRLTVCSQCVTYFPNFSYLPFDSDGRIFFF